MKTRHTRCTHHHWALIDALERGDKDGAMRALTDDITRSFDLVRSRLVAGQWRQCRSETMADGKDETFELYDLRVEVTAPEGGPIYCGAKPGDHFELRGEMLYPAAGPRLFHLFAGFGAAAACGKAAPHPQE